MKNSVSSDASYAKHYVKLDTCTIIHVLTTMTTRRFQGTTCRACVTLTYPNETFKWHIYSSW